MENQKLMLLVALMVTSSFWLCAADNHRNDTVEARLTRLEKSMNLVMKKLDNRAGKSSVETSLGANGPSHQSGNWKPVKAAVIYTAVQEATTRPTTIGTISTTTTPPSTTTAPATPTTTVSPITKAPQETNLALGASVTGSRQYMQYSPDKITDGIISNSSTRNSFCTSERTASATIDLGSVYSVGRIVLWSRPNIQSYGSQARNIEFRVARTPEQLNTNSSVFAYRDGTPSVRPEIFTRFPSIPGRYVKISKLDSYGYLCVAEVQVFQG